MDRDPRPPDQPQELLPRPKGRSQRARQKKRELKAQELEIRRNKLRMGATIVWLRDDMRLADNHALSCGDALLRPWDWSRVVCVYIDECCVGEDEAKPRKAGSVRGSVRGGALAEQVDAVDARIHNPQYENPFPLRGCGLWYKGESLRTFAAILKNRLGVALLLRKGDPAAVLLDLVEEYQAWRVCWNERYEPWAVEADQRVRRSLLAVGVLGGGGDEDDRRASTPPRQYSKDPGSSLVGLDLSPKELLLIQESKSPEKQRGGTQTTRDLSFLRTRYDCERLTVQTFNGTLLAPPWVTNPEVNVPHGHGFGSVQWYKRALANIPQHHMRLDNVLFQRAETGGVVRSSPPAGTTRTEVGKSSDWSSKSFDELYDATTTSLEDFLCPLPEVTRLIPAELATTAHPGGASSTSSVVGGKNLTVHELGYWRTAGKLMPTASGGELYRRRDDVDHGDAQRSLGVFKQFNPLRETENRGTLVRQHDWAEEMKTFWQVGEGAAKKRLEKFCDEVLAEGLFEGRERFRADRAFTAVLSPYIRFGELTARSCFARGARVLGTVHLPEKGWRELRATFLRRMLWRDLAYWCYWRFPDLPYRSLRKQYEQQKWWAEGVGFSSVAPILDKVPPGDQEGDVEEVDRAARADKGRWTSAEEQQEQAVLPNSLAKKTVVPKTRNRFKRRAKEDSDSPPGFQPPGRGTTSFTGQRPTGGPETAATASSAKQKHSPSHPSSQHPPSNERASVLAHTTHTNHPKPLSRLRAWQRGETGFPLVDAAMRQLWRIGWMPNYLRHVVAQFLVEYLDVDWKHGFLWFDYTLVDTDVAINAHMWQNGGHSGLDQWNFVMHPIFAAKSCDPDGAYVLRWIKPELRNAFQTLGKEYIHCPWQAPLRLSMGVYEKGIGSSYSARVIQNLDAARRTHAEHVLQVRETNRKELVSPKGNEIVWLENNFVLDFVFCNSGQFEWCDWIMKEWEAEDFYGGGESSLGKDVWNPEWDYAEISMLRRRSAICADGGALGGVYVVPYTAFGSSAPNGRGGEGQGRSAQGRSSGSGQAANNPPLNLMSEVDGGLLGATSVLKPAATSPGSCTKRAQEQEHRGKERKRKAQQDLTGEHGWRRAESMWIERFKTPCHTLLERNYLRKTELITRQDFREDSLDFLTVQTADRPRHIKKRELKNTHEQMIMSDILDEWRRSKGAEADDAL